MLYIGAMVECIYCKSVAAAAAHTETLFLCVSWLAIGQSTWFYSEKYILGGRGDAYLIYISLYIQRDVHERTREREREKSCLSLLGSDASDVRERKSIHHPLLRVIR